MLSAWKEALGQMCGGDRGGALGKLIFICFTVCLGLAQPVTDPSSWLKPQTTLVKRVYVGGGDWRGCLYS